MAANVVCTPATIARGLGMRKIDVSILIGTKTGKYKTEIRSMLGLLNVTANDV